MMPPRQGKAKQTPSRPRTRSSRSNAGKPARRQPRTTERPTAKPSAAADAGTALAFRPRTPEDDAYILQLTEEQLGSVHHETYGEPFPRDHFLRFVQSGVPTVVIEEGGKRIGYYAYLLGAEGIMHIHALIIEKSRQKSGIGPRVMHHLEEDARRMGVHTLQVFVSANQEKSVDFTRQLGFNEAYRVPPNIICFHKPLTPERAPAEAF